MRAATSRASRRREAAISLSLVDLGLCVASCESSQGEQGSAECGRLRVFKANREHLAGC